MRELAGPTPISNASLGGSSWLLSWGSWCERRRVVCSTKQRASCPTLALESLDAPKFSVPWNARDVQTQRLAFRTRRTHHDSKLGPRHHRSHFGYTASTRAVTCAIARPASS